MQDGISDQQNGNAVEHPPAVLHARKEKAHAMVQERRYKRHTWHEPPGGAQGVAETPYDAKLDDIGCAAVHWLQHATVACCMRPDFCVKDGSDLE